MNNITQGNERLADINKEIENKEIDKDIMDLQVKDKEEFLKLSNSALIIVEERTAHVLKNKKRKSGKKLKTTKNKNTINEKTIKIIPDDEDEIILSVSDEEHFSKEEEDNKMKENHNEQEETNLMKDLPNDIISSPIICKDCINGGSRGNNGSAMKQ